LHPMQVRYQAALRPDERRIIAEPVRLDTASSGTSMQMAMILCGLLGHFGMHNVFGRIAK
jgi:hypothetical protein